MYADMQSLCKVRQHVTFRYRQLGQCKARPFKFVRCCFFLLFCFFSAPTVSAPTQYVLGTLRTRKMFLGSPGTLCNTLRTLRNTPGTLHNTLNTLHNTPKYITEVYDRSALAPMNKFVYKLHGYIVYFHLFLPSANSC